MMRVKLRHQDHVLGDVCETVLIEHLIRAGAAVLVAAGAHGPVDVAAIGRDGRVYLFDAKADRMRRREGRDRRCYRPRSKLQKRLGIRLAYVEEKKRTVHFVPALPAESGLR